jgi:hypothetical protein
VLGSGVGSGVGSSDGSGDGSSLGVALGGAGALGVGLSLAVGDGEGVMLIPGLGDVTGIASSSRFNWRTRKMTAAAKTSAAMMVATMRERPVPLPSAPAAIPVSAVAPDAIGT